MTENKEPTDYFKNKPWYKALKVLHVLFLSFCYLTVFMIYLVIFTDGTDGINAGLKIASIPVLLFLAWIVSGIPRQIFFYLMSIEGFNSNYSKTRLIAGIFLSGLISIFAAVVVFPVGENKPFIVTSVAPVGSRQFIQTLSRITNSPLGSGGTVTAIDTGSKFLPILLNSLNSASSSINFTTFPWADGEFNDKVFLALVNAAKRGIAVRLLLDAFGSHSLSHKYISDLRAAGGKVAEYHPFNILDPLQYDSRDHIRSIVIDGRIGFTGGMGVTDEWFGSAPDSTFEDMMFELRGSMAQSLQDSFAQIWMDTTGEALAGPLFYPELNKISDLNSFIGITSIPSTDYKPVRDTILLSALSAEKKLYIAASYIIPNQDLLNVLENKARSGVDVRIVSPGENTVAPILRAVWHLDYEQLLEAGVKLYEYQPSMIHTKFIVADDVWSLIGSANIDNRSEALNAENLMGINNAALAKSLDNTFADYLSRSKEIKLSDWNKQYGFFPKVYAQMLRILDKQY